MKLYITLLGANIKHRKGSFFSAMLLMLIITFAFSAVYSTNRNLKEIISVSMDETHSGDIFAGYPMQLYTEEFDEQLRDGEHIKDIVAQRGVYVSTVSINGEEYDTMFYLKTYAPQDFTYKVFSEQNTSYIADYPEPEENEIYLAYKFSNYGDIGIGDTIKIQYLHGDELKTVDYVIKGFYQEPYLGTSLSSIYMGIVSESGMARLYEVIDPEKGMNSLSDGSNLLIGIQTVHFYKEDADMSDAVFGKEIAEQLAYTQFTMSRESAEYYFIMIPEIIGAALNALLILLLIVMLVIIGHSIHTGITMDYVNIGVLKAQGFTEGTIRLLYSLQYLTAGIIGGLLGIALAPFGIRVMNYFYRPVVCLVSGTEAAIAEALLFVGLLLGIMIICVWYQTVKIKEITPLRALSEGRKEIHFKSRMQLPIQKKLLSLTMALRQITSAKRQYVSAVIIASIIGFFLIAVNVVYFMFSDVNSVLALFGGGVQDSVSLQISESLLPYKDELEADISRIARIEDSYQTTMEYLLLEEEKVITTIMSRPELLESFVYQGYTPEKNNEILITEKVGEYYGIGVGDTVTVSTRGISREFIVCGYWQSINDAGMSVCISLDAMKEFNPEFSVSYYCYIIPERERYGEIEEMLAEKYDLEADLTGDFVMYDIIRNTVQSIVLVIYVICVIFILVSVFLICGRTFLKEKKDYGIYKSMGFSNRKLICQFALRFALVSLAGGLISIPLGVFACEPLILGLFRVLGLVRVSVDTPLPTMVIPIVLLCVCFFCFSLFCARKIETVDTKSLIAG